MKNTLMTLAVFGGLVSTGLAEVTWMTDFEEGKKAAAEKDKNLLVDFTGSDWCVWCQRLDEEVFAKEAFERAAEDFVFVKLDFPNDESLVTAEQRAKNEQVLEQYGVEGFPSVLLFDSKGRLFARTGYAEGGAEAYVKSLDELSAPLEKLESAEGEARVEALGEFLASLEGVEIEKDFAAELEELKKLDPEDKSGTFKKLDYQKELAAYEEEVGAALQSQDFEGALAKVDAFLEKHKLEGEERQHVLMGRVMALVEMKDKDKAFAALDEMATLAPDSELGQSVPMFKENIEQYLSQQEAAPESGDSEDSSAEEAEAPAEDGEPDAEKE